MHIYLVICDFWEIKTQNFEIIHFPNFIKYIYTHINIKTRKANYREKYASRKESPSFRHYIDWVEN